MTKIKESDIEIRLVNHCDECEDKPLIMEAYYKDELIYGICLHDESDYDNVKEDLLSSAIYEIESIGLSSKTSEHI